MKIPKIANAMGQIDGDLVSSAAGSETKKNKKINWIRWGSIAACFVVLVLAGAAILPSLLGRNPEGPDGTNSRYKEGLLQTELTAILWPWDDRTVYEQYTKLEIDGRIYRGKMREVSEGLVGVPMGAYTVSGYDEDDKKHTAEADVYALRGIAPEQFVAVKMEGDYYVFQNDTYTPPGTFGELLEAVDLPKVIELNRFSENGDDKDKMTFALKSDDPVWEILSGCGDAVFVEDQRWSAVGRSYLSFTVTSEALGVYKVAMYITADGYLWTNAFDRQYLFRIGEDAAGKILKYAKENSVEVPYEPYRKSIAGTVTEITGDHILIDDSILCVNPEDGITYKVPLEDLRISRYVDRGVIAVGDTVVISYEGEIDEAHGNIVGGAVSVSEAVISGGDVMIPE